MERSRQDETERARALEPDVIRRYWDAYLVANAAANFGNAIKWAGIVIAGLAILIGSRLGDPGLLGGLVVGAFLAAVFFVFGLLVAAQGQMAKATLDVAVTTSPFLSLAGQAKAMSLDAQMRMIESGSAISCPKCRSWYSDDLTGCPACGQVKPRPVSP